MMLWHIADPKPHTPINREAMLLIGIALLSFTSLIAVCIRKPSRADVANQILESGSRSHGPNDNPLVLGQFEAASEASLELSV